MKTENNKLLSTIGLAKKAGKVVCGTDMVIEEIRKHKICFIIYASDVSDNTAKKINNSCSYYHIDCHKAPYTKEELGMAVGKAFAACIGITDKNLSKLITSNL